MTTAYTSLLGLALPVTGELSGTWGDTVNNSITSLLDTSVAGTTNVSTDTDVTLTTTTGAANTARQAILLFSGARTALRTVTAPAQSKIYTVINATTGGFSVKLVGVGPTTGVTIVAGESAVCAWNGSDFIKISNTGGSASFVNLTASGTVTFTGLTASQAVFTNASDELVSNAITGTGNVVMSASPTLTGTIGAAAATLSGNLTLSGGTANGVAYLNGSKVLTTGGAITFDGTNLNVGGGTAVAATSGGSFTGGLVAVRGALSAHQTATGVFQYTSNEATIRVYGSTGVTGQLAFNLGAGGSADSEQMRLTSTGLGIGTSSPAYKLDVAGPVQSSAGYYINGNASGGYIWVRDNYALRFGTNDTERMRLDSSGNLGLGVTPSAWQVNNRAIQLLEGYASISSNNSQGCCDVAANAYNSGSAATSGWLYTNSGSSASLYQQRVGEHKWLTAPSGTAGNAITFTQAMTLDADGRLLIGTTTNVAGEPLQVDANGVGSTTYTALFRNTSTSTSAYNAIRWSQGASGSAIGYIGTGGSAVSNTSFANNFVVGTQTSSSLVFNTNDTERMRIDSSGNLGIGTSSPDGKLDVAQAMINGSTSAFTSPHLALTATSSTDTTGFVGMTMATSDSANYGFSYGALRSNGGLGSLIWKYHFNSASGTELMRLDSYGNLGLGVTPSVWGGSYKAFQLTNAGRSLAATGAGAGDLTLAFNAIYDSTDSRWEYAGTGDAAVRYSQTGSGIHAWYNAAVGTAGNAITFTQAMSLTASGDWLLGKTNAGLANNGIWITSAGQSYNTIPDGENTLHVYSSAASAYRFYVSSGGTINATNTTITAISDQRLKENIRDLDDGLATVMALKPRKFDWKDGKGANIKNARGFIAQEFETVLPDMIEEWLDPAPEGEAPYKAVNANLIPTLVKAIQELKLEFDAYKAAHP